MSAVLCEIDTPRRGTDAIRCAAKGHLVQPMLAEEILAEERELILQSCLGGGVCASPVPNARLNASHARCLAMRSCGNHRRHRLGQRGAVPG
jgi:hypothetical protein